MKQIPVISNLWSSLTEPSLPSTSISISATHLAMISLRRSGRAFTASNLGVQRLPADLVQPSFTELNVTDETALIELLKKTATQAGLGRLSGLSATLPSVSARSQVITLDALPGSRAEIEQTIEWKIERITGQKIADMRVDYRRLQDLGGRPQWIFSAVFERVAAQYEAIFRGLGWRVGLLAPQFLGESQWLLRQESAEDRLMLSLNEQGFNAVVVRGREPLIMREVLCSPEEREDEFYRLMIFYRDRLASAADSSKLIQGLLTIGTPEEQQRFRDVLSAALEQPTVSIEPRQLGLKIDPNAPFNHFAGAGGLATMAWG
jgi:Tfp pilus assembly PilM family ATPase